MKAKYSLTKELNPTKPQDLEHNNLEWNSWGLQQNQRMREGRR